MPVSRAVPEGEFNEEATLPYELRLKDFELAMQDAYDLLFDINSALSSRGLRRIEETIRPAVFSGFLSDTIASALARHARVLTSNSFHNGHPDLIPEGVYPRNAAQAGDQGVEIKVTGGSGGVDTHGARDAWLCLFRYRSDVKSEPAVNRAATVFTEVLLGRLELADFRSNERGRLGTRTATPNKEGLTKLRANWVYQAS
jgi:hypothetical protein